MNDIVVGVLALLTGAVFCFRGYIAMRIVIPIWGGFAGFMLGAGLVAGDSGFLGTALGWVVAIVLAVVFALIAYLYYEIAVLIGMMAIGFVLGTSLMVAIGVTWNWVIVLSGVMLAVVLSVVAIVGDLPMALLTVLTALAGASTIVAGSMLLVGVVDTEDFDVGLTTREAGDDWWWYAIYVALAVAGMIVQFADVDRRRATLRESWSTGVTAISTTD
jgi:hypothetical protein